MITDWNRGQGGAEAYMSWMRSGLTHAGDEVRLLTSSAGSAADGTADYVAYGTDRPTAQAFLQIVNPFAMRTVRKAVGSFRPDVAYVNMFAHHLSPAIFPALGNIPVVLAISDYKCICPIGSRLWPDMSVCTVRAGWVCHQSGCVSVPHWIRDRPRYGLLRLGVARAARVVACSEWVRRELAREGIDSECMLLPVPRPGTDYLRIPSPEPSVFFCGRLDIEKGVDRLLRAFAQVLVSNANAVLRIAGRGPERSRLEALARELGILPNVVFLGWLAPSQVEHELSSAWVLVAPSLWAEPLGLVALEAIVRGVPVVASELGGFAETVEEGISGMLVPNGDVDALARALTAIVSRQAFTNGIPDDVVRRVSDRHEVASHVTRIRAILSEAATGVGREPRHADARMSGQ